MDLIGLTTYGGYFLLIIGTLGAIFGPMTDDPLRRFLNIEVPSMGVLLIFLAYNETLALMTYLGVNTILMLVLVRAILKNEELEE
ncbi:MAG: energy-converting hydrogenase subunit [Methanothermococcus sp.]|uniref:EhaE family protein n=1 Tax=Methanothermococcus TaxID=155862 RepID=UPI0003790B10|nr:MULTISPECIES: EhaE family protein [Methanothermococcus]MDK2789734.1 energy-converting hydrogenase subunit [Methanothermococcus sp.]MDK2986949.1 energy-converting hydrogenase subunit [Methanothermococcus sp.]